MKLTGSTFAGIFTETKSLGLSLVLPSSSACAAGGGSAGFAAFFPRMVIWAGGGEVGHEGGGNTSDALIHLGEATRGT